MFQFKKQTFASFFRVLKALSFNHNGLIVKKVVKAKVYGISKAPEGHGSMFSEVLAPDFGSKIEHCCQSRPLTASSFAARTEQPFGDDSCRKYIKYRSESLFARPLEKPPLERKPE